MGKQKMTPAEAVVHTAKRLIRAREDLRQARKASAEASTKFANHLGFKSKQLILVDEQPWKTAHLESIFPYFRNGDYGVTYETVYDYLRDNWQKERDELYNVRLAEEVTSCKAAVRSITQQLRNAVLKLEG